MALYCFIKGVSIAPAAAIAGKDRIVELLSITWYHPKTVQLIRSVLYVDANDKMSYWELIELSESELNGQLKNSFTKTFLRQETISVEPWIS
jgi:hypothetical protein